MATKPQGNPKPFDVSHVPPAARRAAEEAQRLQEQLINGPNPEPENKPQEAQEQTTENTPKPEQRPADGQGSFSDERPGAEPRPAPTNPEPPREEKVSTEPSKPQDPGDNWEEKYKREHGRLEAARSQISEMSERMDAMAKVMGTMQAVHGQPPQQDPNAPPPAEEKFTFITPEMEQEWGPELLKVIEAKAKELTEPLRRQLEQQLQQVGSRVETITQNSFEQDRQAMMKTLNDKVPGWIEQNEDPDFVAWLKMPDTYSRRVRKNLLLEAWNSNDASTVAAFFEGFRKEAGIVAPRKSNGAAPSTTARPTLEQFAAPGAHSSAAPSERPAEIEPISRAQIAEFYAKVAAGRYKGKEDEAKAFEKRIFDAQKAGRIT